MQNNTKNFGKGSKRRTENFKKVQENWDFINWRSKYYCCNCGTSITQKWLDTHLDLYIIHSDGQIECKNCNFN